jgi:ribosome-associated heat shock protein Hsp15
MAGERQRIDKWLWFARFARSRTLAQKLAASGHVRINRRKIDNAAAPVAVGDVLTVGVGNTVRVVRIVAFAERRCSTPEARLLYEDLAKLASSQPESGE